MNRLRWLAQWLRDWFRGYTDADVISLYAKREGSHLKPGSVIELTRGEYRALISGPPNR